jgi:hypothetical protein
MFVAESRRLTGLSREAVAQSSAGRLSAHDLTMIERGRLVCLEPQLGAIEEVLGLRFEQSAPTRTRLIVDPDQGRLVMGGRVAQVLPDTSDNELLLRYLTLVYLCRRARPGSYVVPRADDVETLATVMNRRPVEVRQALARLPYTERDALRVAVRTASNRSVLPGLGLFVGIHRHGALLMVDPDTPGGDLRETCERSDKNGSSTSIAQVVPFQSRQQRRDRR